jgi:hypothetical protein
MKPEERNITRTDVAEWYRISERALRYRMAKSSAHVSNRILTKDDVRYMIKKLGDPPSMPPELAAYYAISDLSLTAT